jgi:hypothetical protein
LNRQFRILEGRSINELPWEFPARMRPTLQIYLAAAFSKIADTLGITNRFDPGDIDTPYAGARIFSGTLALYAEYDA